MIWGAVRGDGRHMRIKCNGNVDTAQYQNILNQTNPYMMNYRSILQFDEAPCHWLKSTSNFLLRKSVLCLPD